MSSVRRSSLLASFAVATVACGSVDPIAARDLSTQATQVPLPVTRLRAEPYPLTFVSGMRTHATTVVRDDATWRSTWATIWQGVSPQPALPAVDFARETIVVAAHGERQSGGYTILIDSAATTPTGAVVWLHTTSPGASCATGAAFSQPVDAARLPRVDGAVTFVERADVTSC